MAMDLVPEALERHIASLCESTAALALVSRAWRAAAKDAESHEPYSVNGSTWCHVAAAQNGPVHMRYLRRIDLTLQGFRAAQWRTGEPDARTAQAAIRSALLGSASTAMASRPPTAPVALWVSSDTFDACGYGPTLDFVKSRCWSVFCCVDYDYRTFQDSVATEAPTSSKCAFYVDANEVHLNASLMAIAQLGPSVRTLFVYEDPLAVCSRPAIDMEPAAFYRAWTLPGLQHLTFSGLVSAQAVALALSKAPRRFFDSDGSLKPLTGLKTLQFLYTTRAPWTPEFGAFLGLVVPALEQLKIYGSNLVSSDLECLAPEKYWAHSLKTLNVEGNFVLRGFPNGCLERLKVLECLRMADTGIERPPGGVPTGTLRELSCNFAVDYGPAWALFMLAQPLETIRLVYMNLARNSYYPAAAMQGASLIEVGLKDRFGRDDFFAYARALTPRALVRPLVGGP